MNKPFTKYRLAVGESTRLQCVRCKHVWGYTQIKKDDAPKCPQCGWGK